MLRKHGFCRLCRSPQVSCVIALPPIPVGEHYADDPYDRDIRYPCDIYQCLSCGTVQTQDDIDAEFLWADYTYFSGQSEGIRNHFKDISSQILDMADSLQIDVKTVFDIGSNDGSLLKSFSESRDLVVWGIDPADTVVNAANASGIETYKNLFNTETLTLLPQNRQLADVICAFNVFAHSNDLPDMLAAVGRMLKPEGLFVFEVQYLVDIINKNIMGTFFHEHMVHYSITTVEKFLSSHNLKIISVRRNSIQMGSVVVFAVHKLKDCQPSPEILQLKILESELHINDLEWGQNMMIRLALNRDKAFNLIEQFHSNGWKVSAYGAARSGPSLLIFHNIDRFISAIYDDHWMKVGKYTPFKNIKVEPTQNLGIEQRQEIAVITAYIHAEAIISHNIKFLERGGRFLLLWPDVYEITFHNFEEVKTICREIRTKY